MSPIRQRLIGDMQLRNSTSETQRNYVHHIFDLARYYRTSPEHLNLEDLRDYLLYLI
ncbi:MAG: phage integrase N-terminal SAM-like domain-containing protein, partial [Bryobacteraceae bacterium]